MNRGHNAIYPENGTYVSTERVLLLTCSRGCRGAGATQTGCGTSLLGRDCSPLITPRRETRLHEKGCRGERGGEKPTTGAAAHVAAKGDVGAETSFPPTFCLNEGFHPGSPPLGCQHRELVANIGLSKVFQPHFGFQGVTCISN